MQEKGFKKFDDTLMMTSFGRHNDSFWSAPISQRDQHTQYFMSNKNHAFMAKPTIFQTVCLNLTDY